MGENEGGQIRNGIPDWSEIFRHCTSSDSERKCEEMKVLGSKLGAVASPKCEYSDKKGWWGLKVVLPIGLKF